MYVLYTYLGTYRNLDIQELVPIMYNKCLSRLAEIYLYTDTAAFRGTPF